MGWERWEAEEGKGWCQKESINLLASLKINLKQKFFLWTFPSPVLQK